MDQNAFQIYGYLSALFLGLFLEVLKYFQGCPWEIPPVPSDRSLTSNIKIPGNHVLKRFSRHTSKMCKYVQNSITDFSNVRCNGI